MGYHHPAPDRDSGYRRWDHHSTQTGKFVANESLPEGGYTLQIRVFNVSDPYTGDMASCAVVVGANGRGTAGIPLNLSTTPASICFPSAEIPDQVYVPGVGGCRIFSPLAVTLASFDAINTANGVLLRWETTTEIRNRGFNLYRSELETGPWAQLNAFLIPSQGMGNPSGFVYEYLDGDVTIGATYYYLLEDVSVTGQTTQHGPVSITYLGVPTAVALASFDAQAPTSGHLWPVLIATATGLAIVATLRKRRTS